MTTLQLLELHPDQLTADANVRMDLRLDDAFVKSIKVNGIIQPVVAYPDPETPGLYRILAGHRRVAAAVKLGLDVVPVVVVPAPDDVDRISGQLVENIHRADLTVSETAAAYKQLALDFGLPATQIARRTATKIDRVGAAIKVAGSAAAATVLEQAPQLTLDVLAQIAEFEDDPEAVRELTKVAQSNPDTLPHVLNRLRDDANFAAKKAELESELVALGVEIVDVGKWGYAPSGYTRIIELAYEDGRDVPVDDHEAMAAISGIAGGVFLSNMGEPHAEILWCARNGTDNGLIPAWEARRRAAAEQVDPIEHQRLLAEQERTRIAREERDAALRAAETVRTQFIKTLLAKKTPAGASELLIHVFTTAAGRALADAIATRPDRAPGIVFAIALAAAEAEYEGDIRNAEYSEPARRFCRTYLGFLKAWGYGPADIETDLTAEPLPTEGALA